MGRPTSRGPPAPRWSQIRDDRRRGAYPLTLSALAELGRSARTHGALPRRVLRAWARELAGTQPAMGPIQRLAGELAALGRGPGGVTAGRWRRWIARRERELRTEESRIVRGAAQKLRRFSRALTFSHSSVVRIALLRRSRFAPVLRAQVLRSRPGREALDLVRALRDRKLPALLVPDRAVRSALRGSDVVLVGADTLYRDGSLLHKVGTRKLAELSARAGVPFIVIAGGWKCLPVGPPRSQRPPAGYDRTPPRLITAYWTERGVEAGGRSARPPTAGRRGTR